MGVGVLVEVGVGVLVAVGVGVFVVVGVDVFVGVGVEVFVGLIVASVTEGACVIDTVVVTVNVVEGETVSVVEGVSTGGTISWSSTEPKSVVQNQLLLEGSFILAIPIATDCESFICSRCAYVQLLPFASPSHAFFHESNALCPVAPVHAIFSAI